MDGFALGGRLGIEGPPCGSADVNAALPTAGRDRECPPPIR